VLGLNFTLQIKFNLYKLHVSFWHSPSQIFPKNGNGILFVNITRFTAYNNYTRANPYIQTIHT